MAGSLLKVQVPEERFSQANRNTSAATKIQNNVRRPTRGITLRDDTFASLRVVTGAGVNQKIIDAGSRLMNGDQPLEITIGDKTYRANEVYSNFLLQNIMEDRQEKVQILETFGEPYIFLFGERPRILACQGILLNTWDFNWEAEWWANYDSFLRGTRCVENDARVYLAFDNTLVGGYIISSNAQKTAQDRHWVQFQFQLFVTYYETFSNLGDARAFDADVEGGFILSKELNDSAFAKDRPSYTQDLVEAAGTRVLIGPDGKASTVVSLDTATTFVRPSELADAWRSVQQLTRKVISTASDVWSGAVVRVPEGFEGSFYYDDAPSTQAEIDAARTAAAKEASAKKSRVVRYTTFSDNDDEYVGSSSHYGSSDLRFTNTTETLLSQIEEGKKISDKAADFWRKSGLEPGDTLVATLARAVKMARVTLVAVNGATALAGLARRGSQPSVPDMTGSAFNWNDNWGGMLSRNQDNAFPE